MRVIDWKKPKSGDVLNVILHKGVYTYLVKWPNCTRQYIKTKDCKTLNKGTKVSELSGDKRYILVMP